MLAIQIFQNSEYLFTLRTPHFPEFLHEFLLSVDGRFQHLNISSRNYLHPQSLEGRDISPESLPRQEIYSLHWEKS